MRTKNKLRKREEQQKIFSLIFEEVYKLCIWPWSPVSDGQTCPPGHELTGSLKADLPSRIVHNSLLLLQTQGKGGEYFNDEHYFSLPFSLHFSNLQLTCSK